jgi:hypothetical protein
VRRKLVFALLLPFLVCLPAPTAAQDKPGDETTQLLDALLTGLLGFKESTEAELQKEVEEVGGIPFRSNVAIDFIGRPELARYLRDVFDSEYPEAQARADARVLVAFDLLPPGTDLRAVRAKVLEENIAGFYDERPGKKRLYAVSNDQRLTPVNQVILAHELRHALQDQYVDVFRGVPESVGDFDDRRLAFMSLLEGDAMVVMERFLKKRLGGELPVDLGGDAFALPDVPGAPPVVRDELTGPYFAGRTFVDAILRDKGWEGVKRAWSQPPASMEQVLHPEKYASGEQPRTVRLSYRPPRGRPLADGVLGEFLLRTLLGEGASPAATAGWGGDAWSAWDVSGQTLVVWRSVWDSPVDEAEFWIALVERYTKSHGPPRDLLGFRLFERGSARIALRRDQEGILLLACDDAGVLVEAARGLGQ